jgi:isopenicillin-N epimerase
MFLSDFRTKINTCFPTRKWHFTSASGTLQHAESAILSARFALAPTRQANRREAALRFRNVSNQLRIDMFSRRQLFQHASKVGRVAGIAGAAALWRKQLQASPEAAPDDEKFWISLRAEFSMPDDLIFLNAANVCPAARPVVERHFALLRDFYSNPSFENRHKFQDLEIRSVRRIARLLGCLPNEVTLTRNTSESTNLVVRGLNLRAGDEIILSSHNHPSNNASWKVLAKRTGLVIREIPTPLDGISEQRLTGSIERAISPRTRVIAITHVTNTNGLRYPAQQIAALAKDKNIWVHLDGAQSLGMLDFRVSDIGCHSYAASMHKWPMGPLEAGVLFVKQGEEDKLWPSIVTAGYSEMLEGASRFGVLGQRDNPRLVAAGEAAGFLQEIGMKNVEARLMHLTNLMKQQLGNIPSVKLLSPEAPEHSGAIVRFRLEGRNTQEVGRLLWTEHTISGAVTATGPLEGIRWCPHVYNGRDQVERAVEAVKALAA